MQRESHPLRLIIRFWQNRRGVTAIEYALLGGLVAVAIVVGAGALGSKLNVAYALVASLIPAS